jgi:hypothetical protein
MTDTGVQDVAVEPPVARLPRAAGGMSLLGEMVAGLLNALHAACALYPLDRRQGIVESLLAVEQFLADLSQLQGENSAKALSLAVPLRMHLEDLKRLPPRDARRLLHHQWSRRIEHAAAGACVQMLVRLGWKQRLAADHVGRLIAVPWQTVLSWRTALEGVALAADAGEENDPRPDVTAYHVALADPDADEAAALIRIDALLACFWQLTPKPSRGSRGRRQRNDTQTAPAIELTDAQ